MTAPNHLSLTGCEKMGQEVRIKGGGPRGRASCSFLSREGGNRWGEWCFKLPDICAAFLNLPLGAWQRRVSVEADPGHTNPSAKASDSSCGTSPGCLHVCALCMGRGAGSRGVVEAVFTKRLGISWAADDDAATKEAESRAYPARVQGVAKAHNGGLTVGTHRKPDSCNNTTHGWGERERKGNARM